MTKRIPTYCPRCAWDNEIHGMDFDPVDITALREENERLKDALARIEKGCSFPADDVQKAIRDVARSALK